MALLIKKVKYIVVVEAVKKALWIKVIASKLSLKQESICIYCYKYNAIQLSKNHVYHERTKHIDVKFHFIKYAVGKGIIKLVKFDT